ncbi:MAG: tetratricopeptide repeat protein [Bacteroidia bacterium]|nr:tetratricopeptide repeat protein [Bacteroidia bacterium]
MQFLRLIFNKFSSIYISLLILTITLLLNGTVNAANPSDTLITAANNHYKKGEYGKAIEIYEKVLASGKESSELYFNLGNSYYKAGILGSAIVNYERAKKLSPGDEDITYNLDLVHRHVMDKIEEIPVFFLTDWFNKMVNITSSDHWAYISIILFIIFLLLFVVFLFSTQVALKKISFGSGIFILLISITSFGFSYKQKKDLQTHNEAVVFSPAVTAKSSPDEAGNDLFVVHEGTKVRITDSIGNWKEIRLSDGNKGWVQKSTIAII